MMDSMTVTFSALQLNNLTVDRCWIQHSFRITCSGKFQATAFSSVDILVFTPIYSS
jgi:hypothetical protein